MTAPDWIVHVRSGHDVRESWCGVRLVVHFALEDEAHARACVTTGSRLVPCDACMRVLEAWNRTISIGED